VALLKTKFSGFSLKDILENIKNKKFSANEMAQDLSKEIEECNHLNMFISNIKGEITTAGSAMLKNFIAPFDSTIVKKFKENGFDFYGKLNMDEFAAGSSGKTSHFGLTKSPWTNNKGEFLSPGGSSSGSAAAVASGLSVFAMGTDTGGSVRQPAAWSGLFGLKPTYGNLSRYGIVDFGSALDCPSIFTKTLEDMEFLFKMLKGKDINDFTTYDYIPQKSNKTVAILEDEMPREIAEQIEEARKSLEKKGYKVVKFKSEFLKHSLQIYYILAVSEFASNLARYNGIFYGDKEDKFTKTSEIYVKTRSKYFGEEVKRRIVLGNFVMHSGNVDGYYKHARKVLSMLWKEWENILKETDAVLLPTSSLPMTVEETLDPDPLKMYLCDYYTCFVNLLGIPGMNIPMSLTKCDCPVGIQLVSRPFGENLMFEVAKNIDSNFFNKFYVEGNK